MTEVITVVYLKILCKINLSLAFIEHKNQWKIKFLKNKPDLKMAVLPSKTNGKENSKEEQKDSVDLKRTNNVR